MEYARENLTRALWAEASGLTYFHNEEVGLLPREDFSPDWEKFSLLDSNNTLEIFTARNDGMLVGYATYMIGKHHYYSGRRFATQDLIYMKREYRGKQAFEFMKFINEKLKFCGVDIIICSTAKIDYSGALKALGYSEVGKTYARIM